MAQEPTQATKEVVDSFIDEGDYQLGGPGPHMSESEIEALMDDLHERVEAVLPEASEKERALAIVDAYEYFMSRLLAKRGEF